MSLIYLDFRRTKEPLKLTVGEIVGISIDEDNIKSIIYFTMAQFEALMDKYCSLIGETSLEECRNYTIRLLDQVKELKEQIEIQEEFEILRKKQIEEHRVYKE